MKHLMRNVACLALLAFVGLASPSQATAPAAPGVGCSAVISGTTDNPDLVEGAWPFTPSGGFAATRGLYAGNWLTIGPDGSLYLQAAFAPTNAATTGTLSQIMKLNTSCNTVWTQAFNCGSTGTTSPQSDCYKDGLVFGPSGALTVLAHTGTTAGQTTCRFQKLNPATGLVFTGAPNYILSNSDCPAFAGALPGGLLHSTTLGGGGYIAAGQEYIVESDMMNGRLLIYNDTARVGVLNYPQAGTCGNNGSQPVNLRVESGTTPFAYVERQVYNNGCTGIGGAFDKIDLAADVSVGNVQTANTGLPLGHVPPPQQMQGSSNAGKLIQVVQNSGSNLLYVVIDKATTTASGTNFATNGGYGYWTLAGDNSALLCGHQAGSTGNQYDIGWTDGTAGTLTTFPPYTAPSAGALAFNQLSGGVSTAITYCQYDYNAGLWAVIPGECTISGATGRHECMLVQHYTTGSPAPAYPLTIDPTIYPNMNAATNTTTTTSAVSAGGGLVSFAASIGFITAPDRFLFGLLLVAIIMVITFAIPASFLKNKQGTVSRGAATACGIVAGIMGIGTMMLNTVLGFWTLITAVLLGILAAGLLATATRKLIVG